jgi:hypothetical protein
MIEAAVKSARGQGSSPPPLVLAFWCGDNHLPEAGGVLDQNYTTMRRMTTLRNVHNAVRDAPKYTGTKIHDMPAGMKRTIAYLREEGLWELSVGAE